jgi:hypothetical protein
MSSKQEFVTVMGGSSAQAGSVTVQELADAIEESIRHFLTPGNRVNNPETNNSKFWSMMIDKCS